MKRAFVRGGIALALVAAGWAAGRAQQTQPDFEIRVTAPVGATQIECVKGCNLSWVERGVTGVADKPTFDFRCGGGGAVTCGSGRIGGWLVR